MNEIKPGDTVDVTIKDVRVTCQPSSSAFVRIADEHGDTYALPPQAAITPAASRPSTDATTLQKRINDALNAIDRMADEQTLDPWQTYWLRKQLDPNPRHWPPQAGDVWDDGMPFGGSLWFAQVNHGMKRSYIVMVPVESGTNGGSKTPDELLQSSDTLKLVYRHKDGAQ